MDLDEGWPEDVYYPRVRFPEDRNCVECGAILDAYFYVFLDERTDEPLCDGCVGKRRMVPWKVM